MQKVEVTPLKNLLAEGFGVKEKFSCAEKILYGSNIVYNLGLSDDALKMSTGFGGGMYIGYACGAYTSSIMVLGRIFTKVPSNQDETVKLIVKEFFDDFKKVMNMDTVNCFELITKHSLPECGCQQLIFKTAELLDNIIHNNIDKAN